MPRATSWLSVVMLAPTVVFTTPLVKVAFKARWTRKPVCVRGVVRPVQGDCGRLLVLHDGACRQAGRAAIATTTGVCHPASESVRVGQPPPGGMSLKAGLE